MELIDRPETAIKPEFSFKESRASSRFVFEGENVEIGYTSTTTKAINDN